MKAKGEEMQSGAQVSEVNDRVASFTHMGHCDENNSDAYSRRECHQDAVIALTFEV